MILTAGKSCRGMDRRIAIESRGQFLDRISITKLTEELNGLNELVVLRQVYENDSLDLGSVCHVSDCTSSTEQDSDDEHDSRQNSRELLGFFHRLSDGNDAGSSIFVSGLFIGISRLTVLHPRMQRRPYRPEEGMSLG